MITKLDISTIRLFFCVCCQAERSVDYAIQADKKLLELKSYYSGKHSRLLAEAIDAIVEIEKSTTSRKWYSKAVSNLSIRIILMPSALLGIWRSISVEDIAHIKKSLKSFQDTILSGKTPSTVDKLIELRIQLYTSQYKLGKACLLTRHLDQLRKRIEHLGQNTGMKFQEIDHLLR